MAAKETRAECAVKIENKDIKYSISSLRLEQRIDDHHHLLVGLGRVADTGAKSQFIEFSEFTGFLGKILSLTITPRGGLIPETLASKFVGVVTEVRMENTIDSINQIFLCAHSPTYLLDTADKNAFYMDKGLKGISDLILKNYSGRIELGPMNIPASTKYKFCVQHKESDYRFLSRLAEKEGLWIFYDGTRFSISSTFGNDIVELIWDDSLGSFSVGLRCEQQIYQTEVYNYEEKKTYSQITKSVPNQSNPGSLSKLSIDSCNKILTNSSYWDFPKTAQNPKELDRYLSVKKAESKSKLVLGKGQSCVPAVSVGNKIQINKMKDLDGQYLVTAVTHHFDQSGSYHNTFEVVPVDLAYPQITKERPSIAGLQTGVVTDNADPDHMGRVKVRLFWNSDQEETPWIRVLSPHAGKDRGWFCLPEKGDEVLIGFDRDHPETPVVVGSLYNKVDAPRSETKNNQNDIKVFVTKGGNRIFIKDTDNQEEITITTKEGKNQVSLKMGGTPQITLKSDGKILLDAKEIVLKAKKTLSCSSDGKTEVKGTSGVKVEGSRIDLN